MKRDAGVIGLLAWGTGGLAVALSVLTLVSTARGKGLDDVELVASALLWLGLLAQGVIGVVLWSRAGREDGALFIPYLLTAVLVMPLALFWALGERSRYGTGVLAAGAVTEVVLVLRTWQIWVTGG